MRFTVLSIKTHPAIGDNLSGFIAGFKLNPVVDFCQNQYFL